MKQRCVDAENRGMMYNGSGDVGRVNAQPNSVRTARRRACVQSLDRTQRRGRSVRRQSNTVRESGMVACGHLGCTNTPRVFEIVIGSVLHPVRGDAYHR